MRRYTLVHIESLVPLNRDSKTLRFFTYNGAKRYFLRTTGVELWRQGTFGVMYNPR